MNTNFEGKTETGKDEWLTPPELIKKIGPFDLDPCSPIKRPWDTAKKHFSILENGLIQEWEGLVFCNPPYGKNLSQWIEKAKNHNNSICLTFARTETKTFFNHVWNSADAILFIKGRLNFYHVNGQKGGTAGAPSILIAYGKQATERLKNSNIEGKFIEINPPLTK